MLKRLLLGFICSIGISSVVMAGDITDTGKSDKDVYTYYTNIKSLVNDLTMRAKTQTLNNPLLRSSGTQSVVGTTTFYLVNGSMYIVGTGTKNNGAIGTTAVGTATGTHQVYAFTVNSSGTITSNEGTPSNGTATVTLPNIPENEALLGLLWLYGSGSTAFLPGTHTLTWATVTTYYVPTTGMVDFVPGSGSTNSLSLTDL